MLHTRLGDEHRLTIVGRHQTTRSLSSDYQDTVTATYNTRTATVPPHSLGHRQLCRDLTEVAATVATMEAMKMEVAITTPRGGTISRLAIGNVQQVEGGDLLEVIIATEETSAE